MSHGRRKDQPVTFLRPQSNTNIVHNQKFLHVYQLLRFQLSKDGHVQGACPEPHSWRRLATRVYRLCFSVFSNAGGTKVNSVPDMFRANHNKFLANHKDLLRKYLLPEEIVNFFMGRKIDTFSVKIKAAINDEFNPKASF